VKTIGGTRMRRLLRPLWIALAVTFLIEAWLWDHLRPVVAAVVAVVPWQRLKAVAKVRIERLPPEWTVGIFLIPLGLVVPLKLVAMWLLAQGDWAGAVGTFVCAKLVGLGVTAFAFDVCRDKLLQLAWFCRVYGWVLAVRRWAHDLVDPIVRRLRNLVDLIERPGSGRLFRFLARVRSKMQRPQPAA